MWDLYGKACKRFSAVSTLIERDYQTPSFPVLMAALQVEQDIAQKALK